MCTNWSVIPVSYYLQNLDDRGCDYFLWIDKDVCEHCTRVMWRLKTKEDALDKEAKLREAKFDAEISEYKKTVDIELARIRLKLDDEKGKCNALEKNLRMALATCLILAVLLALCGGIQREKGYCTFGRTMLP